MTERSAGLEAVETQRTDEREDVVATVLDYFEGWFEGDTARMDRALHPELAKRSLGQVDPGLPELRTVTKERMLELTGAGEGTREAPDDPHIEVDVVDLHGNIATVVVRSAVYREYLHLVKTDGGWKIVNALWHFS